MVDAPHPVSPAARCHLATRPRLKCAAVGASKSADSASRNGARSMSALLKWTISLAGTALVAAVSYQWLDRPIALIFHRTSCAPSFIRAVCPLARPLGPVRSCHLFWPWPVEPVGPGTLSDSKLPPTLQYKPDNRGNDESAAQICVWANVARDLDAQQSVISSRRRLRF